MIQNDRIIKIVKDLNLPQGEYVVFGSALLDVYGLRQSNDIDLLVTKELFEQLKNRDGWHEKNYSDNGAGVAKNDIEAFWQFPSIPWFDENMAKKIISQAQEIGGVNFANFQDTIAWKTALGREKDLQDVKLLKEFLDKNQNPTKSKYPDAFLAGDDSEEVKFMTQDEIARLENGGAKLTYKWAFGDGNEEK